jgi:hypothetical protein
VGGTPALNGFGSRLLVQSKGNLRLFVGLSIEGSIWLVRCPTSATADHLMQRRLDRRLRRAAEFLVPSDFAMPVPRAAGLLEDIGIRIGKNALEKGSGSR